MILENFYYQLFLVLCVGLIFGSFYNVVICRIAKGESIIYPASHCPDCGKELLWWQNIPIFSYLYLKGRCYFCKTPIDIQYPVIELITAGLFMSCFLKFGLGVLFFKHVFVLSGLLILSVFDIKEQEIPKKMVYAMCLALLFGVDIWGVGLAFLLVGGGKYIFDKLLGKETIGLGDVAVLTILGGVVGLYRVLPLIILSVLGQFVICLPCWVKKIIADKRFDIFKLGAWFLASYFVLFVNKMYVFTLSPILVLIFYISLFISLYFLCRTLFSSVNSEDFMTFPFVPAIFIGYLITIL